LKNSKRKINFFKEKFKEIEQKTVQDQEKTKNVLIELITEKSQNERKMRKNQIRENSLNIGQVIYQRKGMELYEDWQNGEQLESLEIKIKENETEREKFDKLKKGIQKQKGTLKKNQEQSDELRTIFEQEEIYKTKIGQLKNKESELKEEKERLLLEKNIQIRNVKIDKEEEKNQFIIIFQFYHKDIY